MRRDEPDLVAEVMARTGHDPCRSARERLCALVDGELGTLDAELVDGHRASCEPCDATARTLGELRATLPTLAELDPGPAFTRSTLDAIRARRAPAPTLGERIAAWLGQRPRLAMEMAYVATLLLTVAVVTPGSPLADVPRRALDLTRTRPELELTAGAEEMRRILARTAAPLDAVGERIGRHAGTFAARFASNTTGADDGPDETDEPTTTTNGE